VPCTRRARPMPSQYPLAAASWYRRQITQSAIHLVTYTLPYINDYLDIALTSFCASINGCPPAYVLMDARATVSFSKPFAPHELQRWLLEFRIELLVHQPQCALYLYGGQWKTIDNRIERNLDAHSGDGGQLIRA
jgi:hypothetical protein